MSWKIKERSGSSGNLFDRFALLPNGIFNIINLVEQNMIYVIIKEIE